MSLTQVSSRQHFQLQQDTGAIPEVPDGARAASTGSLLRSRLSTPAKRKRWPSAAHSSSGRQSCTHVTVGISAGLAMLLHLLSLLACSGSYPSSLVIQAG